MRSWEGRDMKLGRVGCGAGTGGMRNGNEGNEEPEREQDSIFLDRLDSVQISSNKSVQF